MEINKNITPILLCGGSGTRLWPLSRNSFPKQYLSKNKEGNNSFLQMTVKRLSKIPNLGKIIVVCNEQHRFITAEQIRSMNIKDSCIILEPVKRNTAPAVALAALKSIEKGEDHLLLVLPTDHVINNEEIFHEAIKAAEKEALKDKLITFGIVPKSAEIGYGYIKAKKNLDYKKVLGSEIERFIEKPNKDLATKFIRDKRFAWNSGMFMFKASTILKEIKKYAPDIVTYCQESMRNKKKDLYFERINKESFEKCPDISIDKSIMEKTNLGYVLPFDADWSDIGSWKSFWENSEKDLNGNVINGDSLAFNSSENFISSQSRLVVAQGVKDLIIVETNDAVLVTNKNNSENIKDIVNYLNNQARREGFEHIQIFRPWGNYISIDEGDNWKVKKIEVNPKESLSLQLHNHRAEHWIVISGLAAVEIDERKFTLKENESCFIPINTKHRLSNPSELPLKIIEVQSGSYLGEDDIKRFKDKYGRNN